jgi:hypothetical protein
MGIYNLRRKEEIGKYKNIDNVKKKVIGGGSKANGFFFKEDDHGEII